MRDWSLGRWAVFFAMLVIVALVMRFTHLLDALFIIALQGALLVGIVFFLIVRPIQKMMRGGGNGGSHGGRR
jgi:hypothetical protein